MSQMSWCSYMYSFCSWWHSSLLSMLLSSRVWFCWLSRLIWLRRWWFSSSRFPFSRLNNFKKKEGQIRKVTERRWWWMLCFTCFSCWSSKRPSSPHSGCLVWSWLDPGPGVAPLAYRIAPSIDSLPAGRSLVSSWGHSCAAAALHIALTAAFVSLLIWKGEAEENE